MTEHEVNVGGRAYARDGTDLGVITNLIIHPDTGQLAGITIDKGLFSAERIVTVELIRSTNVDGVTLSIDAADAEALPVNAHEMLQRTPGTVTLPAGMAGMVSLTGSGSRWVRTSAGRGEYGGATGATLFLQAPMGHVDNIAMSSLPEGVVLVSEGTDVLCSDGKKVGRVDEVFVDDDNRVTSLLVKSGWLFKHDLTIPANLIASVTHDHLRLSVTAHEIEHRHTGPGDD